MTEKTYYVCMIPCDKTVTEILPCLVTGGRRK